MGLYNPRMYSRLGRSDAETAAANAASKAAANASSAPSTAPAPAPPAGPTFSQQMAQQRLTHTQGLETQKLTGSQAAASQRSEQSAKALETHVAAGGQSTAAFYQSIAAMTAGGHDLARSAGERGAAWANAPTFVRQASSPLPLILGIVGGGAALLLVVTLMIKSASSRGY